MINQNSLSHFRAVSVMLLHPMLLPDLNVQEPGSAEQKGCKTGNQCIYGVVEDSLAKESKFGQCDIGLNET